MELVQDLEQIIRGSGFCKAFKKFGKKQDALVEPIESSDEESEDKGTDGKEESEQNQNQNQNEISLEALPYMAEEDGELFHSN